MYGLEGAASNWNGVKLYPRGMSAYSDDVVVAHFMDWANGDLKVKPLLMTLFDVWVFKSASFDEVPHIVSWVPIDHQPCPPEVVAWCKRSNVFPLAMSKFGAFSEGSSASTVPIPVRIAELRARRRCTSRLATSEVIQ